MKTANIEVTYINHCGDDLSVVNAARVSFHKVSSELTSGDEKLINYLAKHKHFSPFNHAFLSFRVKAPIFVARQLVKHRFMPWNEVSRRYVDDEPEFFFPEKWRKKAANVKQGSSDESYEMFWDKDHLEESIQSLLNLYGQFTNNGMAPEQARMILPQNMMTEWIWSGTLGAFCDMLRLRLDPHTQYESQIVAKKVYDEVVKLFPVSVGALLDGVVPST